MIFQDFVYIYIFLKVSFDSFHKLNFGWIHFLRLLWTRIGKIKILHYRSLDPMVEEVNSDSLIRRWHCCKYWSQSFCLLCAKCENSTSTCKLFLIEPSLSTVFLETSSCILINSISWGEIWFLILEASSSQL